MKKYTVKSYFGGIISTGAAIYEKYEIEGYISVADKTIAFKDSQGEIIAVFPTINTVILEEAL